MILFMEKTWLFWWILAAFLVLRWFHVLCVCGEVEHSDVAQLDFGSPAKTAHVPMTSSHL